MNIYYEQFSHLNKNDHFLNRYLKLITIFKERNLTKSKGLENHHILPKSFGGTNKKENLVYCSLKEHFILHHLLWKAFPGNKSMRCAFYLMTHSKQYANKITFRIYEQLKNEFIERQLCQPRTEETKKKLSEANKGKKMLEETKQKISNTTKGRQGRLHTEETKQKISNTKKGIKQSSETIQKRAETMTGRSPSFETKEKISITLKGRLRSKETILKIRETKQRNRLAKLQTLENYF